MFPAAQQATLAVAAFSVLGSCATPSAPAAARECPKRETAIVAFRAARHDLAQCLGDQPSAISLRVELRQDGTVAAASTCGSRVDGSAIGEDQRACIVSRAMRMTFEPFERPTFSIRVPLRFGAAVDPPAGCPDDGHTDMTFTDSSQAF